jgi:hypothetical protein
MRKINRLLSLVLLNSIALNCLAQNPVSLFNGKNLSGWKQKGTNFIIENNTIVSRNEGSIFFDSKGREFQNFELSCDVKTEKNAIADILFHTSAPIGKEIPGGYAIRIKNTYDGIGANEGLKLTGSIDRIRNIYFPFVKDNEWFNLKVDVEDKRIRVYINGILVNEYIEPVKAWRPDDLAKRILSKGTVGIHNIQGKATFKSIVLTEKKVPASSPASADWEYDKKITELHARNFPLIDFHVHLKDGLTIDEVVGISQSKGINYGVAANCGLHFPVTNNKELNDYLNSIQRAPIFKGMQAEGREWMTLFSPDTAARFEYIFTDAMTWTNHNGKRLRLWIKEETEVGDPEQFMEELVGKIEQILKEPIDIYVNPTYIPEEIQARYDELWTNERMDRVVNALVRNNVAFEINARYKLPGIAFIKKAKAAGVKFTFGTNNMVRSDLEYAYCFKVLQEVGLTPADMWMPRKAGERKIQNIKK